MSDTPNLLSPERVAEIAALSQQEQSAPRGTSKHTYGLAPRAADCVPALLADRSALQAFFDARDKELCQAHDTYRQQVADELTKLIALYAERSQRYDGLWDDDIRAAATRLGIEFS